MSDAHPRLIEARQAVALASDKLCAIESESISLASLIERGELARSVPAAFLIDVATAHGLCRTARGREAVEHIIAMGLTGQSAGVGCTPSSDVDASFELETLLPPKLRSVDIGEFLNMPIPPRRTILSPWLAEKGTALNYAPRGGGKTLLNLGVGYAVASGGELLGWSAPEPRRVLYADAEMAAADMQIRLAAIVAGSEQKVSPDFFRLLSADLIERGLPDLATPEGQRIFDDAIGDAELIILDNISTLCRAAKENESEGWQAVQDWALAHRRAGRSLVFVHHAGKGGNQRGTSKREDILDSVIALRRPQDYHPDQGARFEVHFEKTRGFHGVDAEPFEARYEVHDGAAIWTRSTIGDVDVKRVADSLRDGNSIRQTAVEFGLSKSKIERLKAKAEQRGLLDESVTTDSLSRRLAA